MGEAARQRAIDTFDWSVVIRRYQDSGWELAERRAKASENAPPRGAQTATPGPRSIRSSAFAELSHRHPLARQHMVAPAQGADGARLQAILQSPLISLHQAGDAGPR